MNADPVDFDAVAGRYDRELAQGLALSGEGKEFFLRGRLAALERLLARERPPRAILDFGCGLGETAAALRERFDGARVVGVDASAEMIDHARRQRPAHPLLAFLPLDELDPEDRFDLCYVNGVFHHVPIEERLPAADRLRRALSPGGRLAFFENNPLNPGTRLVMRRIPFDRDAVPLLPWKARRLLVSAGFRCAAPTRYFFIFPRVLAVLRPLERLLARLPLGAQYLILGEAPGGHAREPPVDPSRDLR